MASKANKKPKASTHSKPTAAKPRAAKPVPAGVATTLTPAVADDLYARVAEILDEARSRVARTVNAAMVKAYWMVGREIIEVEQGGKERASYGEAVMRTSRSAS